MTTNSGPGSALSFLDADTPDTDAPIAAFRVLSAQQDAVNDRFREGFRDPVRAFLEMHAAGAVSLGYVPPEWYQRYVTIMNWWEYTAFLSPERVRAEYTDAPMSESVAQSKREDHIEQYLMPAFQQAIRLLREHADEYHDGSDQDARQHGSGAEVEHDNQAYLAMRPGLHQLAVGQHRALRRALGAGPTVDSRRDINHWARQIVEQTASSIGPEWIDDVTRKTGQWRHLLLRDRPGPQLLFRLASDIVPAMMTALNRAAQATTELPEPASREHPEAFKT